MPQQLHQYYLQQMGIELWTTRSVGVNKKKLEKLSHEVSSCVRCPLNQTRTQTVFARGNPEGTLMIIGEAPGFDEDKQGVPFVGRAGQLLNNMLNSIGFTSDDVYIANVLKCRPPENRSPKQEEIDQCSHYLSQQIDLIAPKLILAVGHCSAQLLLKSALPLHDMRAKVHDYQGTPVIVSYHPAYLLRHPTDKKKAYSDLLLVRQLLTR